MKDSDPNSPAKGVESPPAGSPIYLPVDTERGIEYAVIPTGMSEKYYDFLIESLKFHAENHPTFIAKERAELDERPEDAIDCDQCDATGYDGYDRCDPPGRYVCEKCDGRKWIIPENAELSRGDRERPAETK